ncbi:hypothetical protein FB446DRAFT_711955 [Lentinula raphanica]|nr:hypothetical protein FB446DRAFT_711955 [Lentinula raphanica]
MAGKKAHLSCCLLESLHMTGTHHYKMQLHNYAEQVKLGVHFDYQFRGPKHAVVWEVIVSIDGVEYGRGEGSKIRAAEENAAFQALRVMGVLDSER